MFSLSASRSGADPPNPAATRPDPTATAPAPGGGGDGNSDDSLSSSLSTLPSLPTTSTLYQQAPVAIKDEGLGYDSGSGDDDGLPRPNESEVYYFAYGVDFDPVRMKEEILPDAVHLGLARLDGFRWLLCGPPRRECKCTFPLNHPSPLFFQFLFIGIRLRYCFVPPVLGASPFGLLSLLLSLSFPLSPPAKNRDTRDTAGEGERAQPAAEWPPPLKN